MKNLLCASTSFRLGVGAGSEMWETTAEWQSHESPYGGLGACSPGKNF